MTVCEFWRMLGACGNDCPAYGSTDDCPLPDAGGGE